jgi:ABC-2 type transport system permease protein
MNPRADAQTEVSEAILAALHAHPTGRSAGALSSALTFGWRALLKIKHTPEQLFDVIVSPIMFTVMFTYLFGGALAGSPRTYLQFLLPGILVQTVVFTSIYTGLTLNTDISKGVTDRFRSMPIWQLSPIVGAMLGDTIRYSISAFIVVLIGLLMGYRPEAGAAGVVFAIGLLNLFALGFSWIFIVIGLLVRTPSAVMTSSWLILMPATFASNIYVDPATMPGWLQTIVAHNPVAILVDAVRGIMSGAATAGGIGLALIAPALITAIALPVVLLLYRRERPEAA